MIEDGYSTHIYSIAQVSYSYDESVTGWITEVDKSVFVLENEKFKGDTIQTLVYNENNEYKIYKTWYKGAYKYTRVN